MTLRQTLCGTDEERAVSPVIGVILMVAITVILAAVIAAFVLDLGDTTASAQATYDVNQDPDDDSLIVSITSASRLDGTQFVGIGDCDVDDTVSDMDSVGASVNVSTLDGWDSDACAGETVQIIGLYEGEGTVIQTIDVHEDFASTP